MNCAHTTRCSGKMKAAVLGDTESGRGREEMLHCLSDSWSMDQRHGHSFSELAFLVFFMGCRGSYHLPLHSLPSSSFPANPDSIMDFLLFSEDAGSKGSRSQF